MARVTGVKEKLHSPLYDAFFLLNEEETFSDAMTEEYAKVAVTSPDGKSAASGEPRVSGKTVTLALAPTSRAGRYMVGYRVVSADGHPVSGS